MADNMHTVTQADLDSNEVFAGLGYKVGDQVPFDPAVVISREAAIEQGIDVERIEYEARVAEVRVSLLGIEEAIFGLKKGVPASAGEHTGEVMANVMLAYRAAEDSRMRLGKVFQSLNGGKSILNR